MDNRIYFTREQVEKVAQGKEILFVKDQGVYLMYFGNKPKGNVVEYGYVKKGKGLLHLNDNDTYEIYSAICGGDDFGEDVTDLVKGCIDLFCKHGDANAIAIKVTPEQFDFILVKDSVFN